MTAGPSYFDLPEVSCSDLKALDRARYAKLDPFAGDKHFARFGSLVDAMLTEPWRLKPVFFGLVLSTGVTVHFDAATWAKAERMAKLMRMDGLVNAIMNAGKPQYIFRRTLTFEYDGTEYDIRGRCMFDFYVPTPRFKESYGLDFKMLAIGSQKALLEAIEHFDYDMQAAWYMDLSRTDHHVIACGSKTKEKIFRHAIERGDPIYLSGREKYRRLAFMWITLIGGFLPHPYAQISEIPTSTIA